LSELRKAIRRAEHQLPGLLAAVAQRERQESTFAEALCRFAVDTREGFSRREFIAKLLWRTDGTENVQLTMMDFVVHSGDIDVMAAAVIASASEKVLNDTEIALGWWSVGREAQASIAGLRRIPGERELLQSEIRRVFADPNAAPEERRWAECYDTN
jgi:hypothetical protein